MGENSALFIFLAAMSMGLFAFASVVVWVLGQARDRKERDRLALFRTLAEQPGENAQRVLELLREQDRRQAEKRQRDERKGLLLGGLITFVVGLALVVMLTSLETEPGSWTVSLIPLLVGLVLIGAGLATRPALPPDGPRG